MMKPYYVYIASETRRVPKEKKILTEKGEYGAPSFDSTVPVQYFLTFPNVLLLTKH